MVVEDGKGKRDFWAKVAQFPTDSKQWELVANYISLVSDPQASKTQRRALYKSLEEAINSQPTFRDKTVDQRKPRPERAGGKDEVHSR